MKNLKTLLTMAIVALMSLSFTSCDEDADIGDTLYGTWKGYMDIGLTYGDHYLNGFNMGDIVTVSFSLNGSRSEKDGQVRYFTNVQGYKIEKY